ncbi:MULTISPECIES: hypothetical protein [Lactococcus]|uniref:hypothetical protein n=1 Tax=Lactococcus TaxID=1357 RepID=UPI001A8F59C4|nr:MULTISPECIES: hypothetical protein [Lactococcus]MDT2727239.1 hypothetical protein [Lactococcus formosensis]QSR11980.1 hypothetical protein J0J35_06050 [Lactococcus sp. LG606]
MLQEKYEQLIKEKGANYVLNGLTDVARAEIVLSFLRYFSEGEYVEDSGCYPVLYHVNREWLDEGALDKTLSDEDVLATFQTYVGSFRFSQYIQFLLKDEDVDVYFEDDEI